MLFREPSVWRADALAACHGASLVSLITFLPIYLRAVRGTTPAETGLLLLPLMFGIGIGSLVTGQLVTRTGRTAMFPSYGYLAATASFIGLAFWLPHLSLHALPWVFGGISVFMGTVMGVVQVTVQAVAGQRMLGTGAAMVQFSRSVGAAVGTAAVAAVLFSVLASTDRETAKLFASMIDRGPEAIAALAPARQLVVQGEIGEGFRAAFLTIAMFTGIGAYFAWSMPLRAYSIVRIGGPNATAPGVFWLTARDIPIRTATAAASAFSAAACAPASGRLRRRRKIPPAPR